MDLFDRNGHITDDGFALLLNGEPDTLESLELAEHLSFCDACCEKYAALLSGEILLSPPHSLAPAVTGRIRTRGRTIRLRKAFKMGLAATLAMGLWLTGINYGIIPAAPEPHAAMARQESKHLLYADDAALMGTAETDAEAAPEEAAFDPLADTLNKMAQDGERSMAAYTTRKESDGINPTLNMRFSYAMDQIVHNFQDRGEE